MPPLSRLGYVCIFHIELKFGVRVDVLYAPTILSTEPRVQRSVTVHNKTVSLFRGALGSKV